MNDIQKAILEARSKQRELITKGFEPQDDSTIEKAKWNPGDIHPNGKWVFTEYKPGKFDWRNIKSTGAQSKPAAATQSKPDVAKQLDYKGVTIHASVDKTAGQETIVYQAPEVSNKKYWDLNALKKQIDSKKHDEDDAKQSSDKNDSKVDDKNDSKPSRKFEEVYSSVERSFKEVKKQIGSLYAPAHKNISKLDKLEKDFEAKAKSIFKKLPEDLFRYKFRLEKNWYNGNQKVDLSAKLGFNTYDILNEYQKEWKEYKKEYDFARPETFCNMKMRELMKEMGVSEVKFQEGGFHSSYGYIYGEISYVNLS